jgi:hypothetical protein
MPAALGSRQPRALVSSGRSASSRSSAGMADYAGAVGGDFEAWRASW